MHRQIKNSLVLQIARTDSRLHRLLSQRVAKAEAQPWQGMIYASHLLRLVRFGKSPLVHILKGGRVYLRAEVAGTERRRESQVSP